MTRTSGKETSPRRLPGILAFFDPAPSIPPLPLPASAIERRFGYWQKRILISSIVGYALFYFVRKNLSIAMPALGHDLGITKTNLGLFLTLHGVLYGVSKFVHGFLGDRADARTLMVTGLALSAVMNVFFGLSSALVAFGIFWMLNGWVQGMGFPPCARLMTHWFSPKELATKMSIWNTSHSIGAGLVFALCGYLVVYGWRLCFFVPAALAAICAVLLVFALRDTPPSLGLPEVEGTSAAAADSHGNTDSSGIFVKEVFKNPYIWIIALANFFVYTVRYAVVDWGPTLLTETKGIRITHAGWMLAGFEISGVAGMLLSGWLTDKLFGGRGARLALISMLLAGVSVLLFWKVPGQSNLMSSALLCSAGFFIYGPQALTGIIVANLATKRAAATAVGLTGIFGYASTILSGWGFGLLVERLGWNAGFIGMISVSAIGAVVFALAWPAKPHGYARESSDGEASSKRSDVETGVR